jgi:hypothetical protein
MLHFTLEKGCYRLRYGGEDTQARLALAAFDISLPGRMPQAVLAALPQVLVDDLGLIIELSPNRAVSLAAARVIAARVGMVLCTEDQVE